MKAALTKFLLFLFLVAQIHAQVLDLEYYSTRDGLASHGVGEIYQDPLGRLWLGTNEGLSIYDGSEFKNYRSDGGLPLDFITCIAACRESPTAAWIGTLGGGVCKLVDDRFSYIDLGEAKNITTLLEDRHGTLWIGSNIGLYRVNSGKADRYPLNNDKQGVSGIAESKDGSIWIGLTRSAALLKPDQSPIYINLDLSTTQEISTMYLDDNEDVWFGTTGGILICCNERGVISHAKISSKSLRHITAERNGVLWICSEDGLLALDRKSFGHAAPVRYGKENGFSGDRFNCAFVDREDNLWIGQGMGLYKLRDRALLKFPVTPILTGKPPVVVDHANHLWGIDGDGLIELWLQPNSSWAHHRHSLPGGEIYSLQLGGDNTLWIGFLNREIHIYRFRFARGKPSGPLQLFRKLRPGIELPSELWVFFTLDGKGALWLHTYPTGVIILDGEHSSKRTTLTVSDGLPHNDIRAIYEERNGDVWIGGLDGGIAVYRRTGNGYALVRKLVSGAGLDHDEVRAVYLDSLGRCWTGTRWGGVTLTDGDTWRTLTTVDGLLSNAVFSIAADARGTVWIGTHLGLQGIDAESFRLTKTIHGLVGENIGSCGIAGDIVWAFTPKFLATYDLRNAQTNTTPPLISIKEFRVNGTSRHAAQELELSHDENNITIDFSGISLKNEKGVRYQHRLLGAEDDWSTPTPYRAVTYGALEGGAYTFEVHAVNSDGVLSVSPASVSFTVLPP
ncbi:MAG: HATPase c protein, partial [Bacteroidetes bacterium]|nr:HATPase c protein [Bacteroidota bacterium]